MEKFIPYEKLSKKKQRELNAARRETWTINPVTRKPANPKAYNRKTARKWKDDSNSVPFVSVFAPLKTKRRLSFRRKRTNKHKEEPPEYFSAMIKRIYSYTNGRNIIISKECIQNNTLDRKESEKYYYNIFRRITRTLLQDRGGKMKNMEALKCDFCGGNLVINDSREFALCEFCGAKYMKSTIQQKIQEIQGTIKVEGAVETTTGFAEKERRLSNADTFLQLGEIGKALNEYNRISNDFPGEIRGWIGLLKILVNYGNETSLKEIGTSFNRYCGICEKLSRDFSRQQFAELFFRNICSGRITFSVKYIDGTDVRTDIYHILSTILTRKNFQEIVQLNEKYTFAISKLGVDYLKQHYQPTKRSCTEPDCNFRWGIAFFIGRTLINRYVIPDIDGCDDSISGASYITTYPASQAILNDFMQLAAQWKKEGLCQHCGGRFKGVFSRKCSICGKPKDYK